MFLICRGSSSLLWGVCWVVMLLMPSGLQAQQSISTDSLNAHLARTGAFTMYRDNYFLTGVDTRNAINRNTSDVKFQLSFKTRLTDALLPGRFFAFFTYEQKVLWTIYQLSQPVREINYNPALSFGKVLFSNPERRSGFLSLSIEHESNGRDTTFSRNWYRVSGLFQTLIAPNAAITLKAWLPFSQKPNPDLQEYVGYLEGGIAWEARPNRLFFNLDLRKGAGLNNRGSLQAGISWKPYRRSDQYLTLQYFTGYAESLIDYNISRTFVRLGVTLKPSLLIYD